MPLLSHRVVFEQVSLKQPVVHIIRHQRGQSNGSTIGKSSTAQAASRGQTAAGPGALGEVSVSSLTIDDGTIVYQDAGAAPTTVSAVNLDIENFGASTPFDIKLTLAALGTRKNLSLTGKVGPLMK